MKNLPLSFCFLVFLVLLNCQAKAQYFTALGGRSGPPVGISFKQFSHRYRGNAVELILVSYQITNSNTFGYMFTGFYEHQKRLPYFKSLRYPFDYFWGVGAHIGYLSDQLLTGSDVSVGAKSISYGPDAIIGIERRFRKLPLSLGVDIKPFYEITSKRLIVEKFSVTARYVFD